MNEIKPGQSIELLKHLHILTRDGALNQDSRRKLKQVYHLCQFIEPLINQYKNELSIVDHGAGKSYLGFILYDLYLKNQSNNSKVYGIETRAELVKSSKQLAEKLDFERMIFLNLSVQDSINSVEIPDPVGIVTALHACNTATDDAITFALKKNAKHIVLIPCCQAEIADKLRKNKDKSLKKSSLAELWRHPIHTREFGSHITNVLRCLQLESFGYKVTVTELVGWEHSMKNELIIAEKIQPKNSMATKKIKNLLEELSLQELENRFFTPND